MHRCWEVPELTKLIFEHIKTPDPTWAALARTCHAFSEPALDLLWKCQCTIVPFLKCLPANAWTVAPKFKIIRPLQPADWDRAVAYSRRIKMFCEYDCEHCDRNFVSKYMRRGIQLEEGVMGVILMSFPHETLLPNVQTMYTGMYSDLFQYIRLLCGPNLIKVRVKTDGPAERLSGLARLASCPSLRHLDFFQERQRSEESPEITDAISSYICATPRHLEFLSVRSLNPTALQFVAGLPCLRSFTVAELGVDPFPEDCSATFSFPNVHNLTLRPSHLPLATKFMPAVRESPLRVLSIATTQDIPTKIKASIFISLIQHHISLTSFTFDTTNYGPRSNRLAYTLTTEDLRPLLYLSHLKLLHFSTPHRVSFDNDFGMAMSLAWPNIETLHISSKWGQNSEDEILVPTTDFLVSLARNCPHLKDLTVDDLDATGFSSYSAVPLRVRQTSLTSAHFGESRIDESDEVARLLSSIFPSLQAIKGTAGRYKVCWGEVEDSTAMFAIIRAEEREFMLKDEM